MARAALITGGNIGDRERYLDRARRMIAERAGAIAAQSAVRESAPWGEMEENTGAFLNQALLVETSLDPDALLDALQGIERELGRERMDGNVTGRYLSRTMDIDIVFYGDEVVRSGRLTIPHPLVGQREFALTLLAEIMPEYTHPVSGIKVAEMLDKVRSDF